MRLLTVPGCDDRERERERTDKEIKKRGSYTCCGAPLSLSLFLLSAYLSPLCLSRIISRSLPLSLSLSLSLFLSLSHTHTLPISPFLSLKVAHLSKEVKSYITET